MPARVSVVIPTYNRSNLLRRSIESVLGQSYRDLELIISDNASTDATAALAESYVKRDERIRYVRLEKNRGPVGNFENGLSLAGGEFFMWLPDDDWVSSNFVEECVATHAASPASSLVAPRTVYCRGDTPSHDGGRTEAIGPDRADRVVEFYRTAGDNGAFYGLHRRSRMPSLPPGPAVLGFDWVFVARSAFAGTIVHAPRATLYRDFQDAPDYHIRYANMVGLGLAHKVAPGVLLAFDAGADVFAARDQYPGLSLRERARLGARITGVLGGRLDLSVANVRRKLRSMARAL